MIQPVYENNMKERVKASTRINSIGQGGHPGGSLLLYMKEGYYSLMGPLGLRVDSPRGTYKGVMLLRPRKFNGNLLILADQRLSQHIEPNEQVRPHTGLIPVKAKQGQSCVDACAGSGGRRCELSQFAFLNTCEALKAVFPCEKGCGHQTGGDIPNYVPATHQPTYQQCLISDGGADCAASHPDTQRLCPCVL